MDIPVLPESAWVGAVRGRFYRPVKQAVSLRLDADVLAWLKKDGEGYQTRVNQMLREKMLAELEGR
jgi:uncharacterized protein (DUF4415 family)